MKRMLMAIMAVAVLVAFSAPSFADETKGEGKKGKKGTEKPKAVQMIYADDEKGEKKDEKNEGKSDEGKKKKKDQEEKGK